MKNRKKMAGTIAMIMALSLGYNAGGPVVVHAHENAVITEKLGETAASHAVYSSGKLIIQLWACVPFTGTGRSGGNS